MFKESSMIVITLLAIVGIIIFALVAKNVNTKMTKTCFDLNMVKVTAEVGTYCVAYSNLVPIK